MNAELYNLVLGLNRLQWDCLKSDLPSDGIYFFFEKGEQVNLRGRLVERIVRVGTHRGDGNFPGRIRQHYGHMKKLGGNKNGSVFRRHVGGALLRREAEGHPKLITWVPQGGQSDPVVESQVSEWMRQNLSFSCVRVPTKDGRLSLESGLIALLAQQPLSPPSEGWLGRHAVSTTIQTTGLWNTQETSAMPLTTTQLNRLKELANIP
jgi:hypothetical protein